MTICNVSNLLKFALFADDTNIFCSSTSQHDLQDTINRLFNSRPPDNVLALTINNVALPRVAATKFLGIIIDDKLSWKPQLYPISKI